ncbi:MAG: glycosyltransferase [Candidatus Omnitrophica bacterium]|nr:glycosyltransferase [Candidatus Omnitrophota bacterium]
MSDHPDLSIIIVSYNTRDLTLACLRSIESFPPSCRYETIVVYNASRDDSVESIRKTILMSS